MALPPGVKIKDTDKGFQNFKRALEDLDGVRADVGYWSDKIHNDSGLPMVLLATMHEYGTEATGRFSEDYEEARDNPDSGHAGIPARPFLRTAADTGRDALFTGAMQLAREVIKGKRDGLSMLRLVANRFKRHVKKTMDMSPTWAAPLALSTIANRKSRHGVTDSVPLEVTLELRDSVQMRIRKKGEAP